MKCQPNNRLNSAPGRGSLRGFTLMEMILAVGVASIVLVCITTAFFSALRLRESTLAAVDEATPVEQAFALMRRDLQCVVPPNPNAVVSLTGDFKTGSVTTVGVSDLVGIEMYTATGALHENEPWADIQRITYGLKPSTTGIGPGKDLVRTVTRNLLSAATPQIEEQWVLGGVESIQFLCYDGTQWVSDWDTTSTTSMNTNLPTAVRVELQMAGRTGNSRTQPIELVVPIDSQSRTNTNS